MMLVCYVNATYQPKCVSANAESATQGLYLFTINVEFSLVVLYPVATENVVVGLAPNWAVKREREQSATGGMEEQSTIRGLCTDLFVFCMQEKSIDYCMDGD